MLTQIIEHCATSRSDETTITQKKDIHNANQFFKQS